MDVVGAVLVIAAIVAIGVVASRLSDRTLDGVLLAVCTIGAIAYAVDNPHGFDYVRAVAFAVAGLFIAWGLSRRVRANRREGTHG